MGLAKELRQRREVRVREVTVPAWGDKDGDFKLYCKPITCRDLDILQKKHPKFLENTTISGMVDLIVLKALDESGSKLFKAGDDAFELMKEQTDVITDIASQMFEDVPNEDDLAKN